MQLSSTQVLPTVCVLWVTFTLNHVIYFIHVIVFILIVSSTLTALFIVGYLIAIKSFQCWIPKLIHRDFMLQNNIKILTCWGMNNLWCSIWSGRGAESSIFSLSSVAAKHQSNLLSTKFIWVRTKFELNIEKTEWIVMQTHKMDFILVYLKSRKVFWPTMILH